MNRQRIDRLQAHHHIRDHQHQQRPTTSRITSRSSTTSRLRIRRTRVRLRLATIGFTGDAAQSPVRHRRTSSPPSAPGNFPAVSFLKAPGYQDGHAGYSDPLDEQTFVVNTINFLQQQRTGSRRRWSSPMTTPTDGTIIRLGPIVNQSATTAGCADGSRPVRQRRQRACRASTPTPLHAQGRCGYGPRLPLLVISPWAKQQLRRSHRDRPDFDYCALSRTTGWAASASGRDRSTRSPTRSPTCSTSRDRETMAATIPSIRSTGLVTRRASDNQSW